MHVFPLLVSLRTERGFFMARLARVIVIGNPHHVIQRGNRCQKVFFKETDKEKYLEILGAIR